MDKGIEEWTLTLSSRNVMQVLQVAGVAAGSVMDERDLYDDPQLEAQHCFKVLTRDDAG